MPPLKATADETRDLIAFLCEARWCNGCNGCNGCEGATRATGAAGATGANDFAEILKPRRG